MILKEIFFKDRQILGVKELVTNRDDDWVYRMGKMMLK